MRKKSIWVLIGLLVSTVLFAVAGCKNPNDSACKLSETSISLSVGEEKQLTISPAPKGAVSWESDNEEAATVSGGLIRAVGEGGATVTAKIEGVETPLACSVTVTAEKLEINGYSLDFTTVSLKTGETLQLSVLNGEGNSPASVTWSSADPAIAAVSASGLVSAVGNGETLVKAQIEGGTLVCKVTVAQAYVYSLDQTEVDLAVGAIGRITLITTPGGSATNRPHTFTSSDSNIVKVDGGTGKLTGVGKGTAVITCSVDGQELKANVTVTEYTLKIGETAAYDGMKLDFAENYTVSVQADPDRDIPAATYISSDESILTIAGDGKITLKKTGEVTVGAKVAGVTLTADVKVVSDYSVNYEKYELTYGSAGNTVQLEVMDGANAYDGEVTYTSYDEGVATVSKSGVVTAAGIGTTKIKVSLTETFYFETDITVKFGVTQSEVDYADGVNYSVNLDALHETNVTLDWRYYGKENYTEKKNGGSLIGDYTGDQKTDFPDYRVGMNWSDGTTTQKSFTDRTDGRTFKNVSLPVKVTKDVKYIAIFTGAWHATNTVTISYNGVVCSSVKFENIGNNDRVNKNKQIIFTPDAEHLIGSEMEFTITLEVGAESANGWTDNISLVAVAVVGKDERPSVLPNATVTDAGVTKTEITQAGTTFDLSAMGDEDWVYSKNGNSGNFARKKGVSNVILENQIEKSADKWGANDRYHNGVFKWNAVDATAAPAEATVNNFLWVNVSYTIPVHLKEGEHVVTLYLSGWNCGYFVKVMDGNGSTILADYRLTERTENQNHAFEVKIPLNVTTEDTFLFTVTKDSTSPRNGNHGWAAIAVSQESEFTLEKTNYNLTIGGTNEETIAFTGTAPDATYASGDTAIATVDESGKITAVAKGKTYITVSDGKAERRVFVTVTEYTLTSDASLTLSIGATSKITIAADPAGDFEVEYGSSDDTVATVDREGTITAVKGGNATITATVGGKSFEIQVKVESYQINFSTLTLHAGKNTQETQTLSVTDGSGNAVSGVIFNSSNTQVADVNESTGLVTANGVGTATITAHVGSANITCEVTVVIPDPVSNLVELDMTFEDLSRVSSEYKTIDYKHWHSGDTVVMDGREVLIGEPSSMSGNFWDYKAAIGYGFNASGNRNVGMSYGKTSNGFNLPITINALVSEVVFYTGAYKGTATVTFKLGDRVLATHSFTADAGVARKVAIKFDTDKMLANQTLDIVGSIEKTDGNGNINVVAVAVVGKTAFSGTEIAADTATVAVENIEGDGHKLVDLTEIGGYDWLYSHYENPNDKTYRKFNGHDVFTGETYYNNQGNAGDAGILWNGKAAFKWTDGMLTDSEATEGAVNPVDNDGSWEASATGGVDGYTNNCFVKNGEVHITMRLAQGKYVVTSYLYSKNAPIGTAIYDGNNNFIAGKQLHNDDFDGIKCWAVNYTIDVKEASDFTLVIGKVRSHGDAGREVGWQAVAVATLSE